MNRPHGEARVVPGRLAALLVLAAVMGTAAAGAERSASGLGTPELDGATRPGPPGAEPVPTRFSGGREWPALRFHAGRPLDWSDAAALVVPVENPGDQPFTLLIRLDDDPAADGGDRSLSGLFTLPPHARGQAVLPLARSLPGLRGQPVTAQTSEAGDLGPADLRGAVDAGHVVALHLSGLRTADDRVIGLGAPRLRTRTGPRAPDGPVSDGYGQALAGRWPEKVSSDADLRDKLARAEAQTRRLGRDARPLPAASARATGAFRVEKADGRWRLTDAAGRPFFSLGVDAVTASSPTVVSGREKLFAALPEPGTPLARFLRPEAGRSVYDVSEANLARAFGREWRRRWTAGVATRLQAWGFNTLGNWSDPDLAQAGFASVSFYDVEGGSADVPMEGGRALPDPFDPRYPAIADGVAVAMVAANRTAPALLGYFSGNEMPWGSAERPEQGLAAHVLRLGPASPAKQAMVGDLRVRYGSFAALAEAWGLAGTAAGWDGLLARPLALPPLTPRARADLARFGGVFATRYFATVAGAIKRHDPRHLYLGTRFADAPPEVVAACARWCDVLSFNVYGASPAIAASRWQAFDRPVLIGEFHFGSTDRGSYWPGMVDAGGEDRRGAAYAAYLEGALADPAIVGVHWYQYADEPLTGRPYDGENGHIGLVAVTDVPYGPFVEAVAAANRRLLRAFDAAASGLRRTVP